MLHPIVPIMCKFNIILLLDIHFSPELITFLPFERRACSRIFIFDDDIAERNESFQFSLKRTADLDGRIRLNSSPGEILIEDNDGIILVNSRMTHYHTFYCRYVCWVQFQRIHRN